MTLSLATLCRKNSKPVTLDVVIADISAPLGTDVPEPNCLTAETVANRLTKRVQYRDKSEFLAYYAEWQLLLYRSKGNYICSEMDCPTELLLTRSQLHKRRMTFFHASTKKLFDLLRGYRQEESNLETLTVLQGVTKQCDPCQRLQSAPTPCQV